MRLHAEELYGGSMLLKGPQDIPESIRNHLSQNEQSVFLEAYNNAWSEAQSESDPKVRRDRAIQIALQAARWLKS